MVASVDYPIHTEKQRIVAISEHREELEKRSEKSEKSDLLCRKSRLFQISEMEKTMEWGVRARAENLSFCYANGHQALEGIHLSLASNRVTALIGPSGCGKSSLLRCFNRMHDLYPGNVYKGSIRVLPDDIDIVDKSIDPMMVRMRVGMVFQKPNPFPKSIYDNVAAGLRVRGIKKRSVLDQRVEQALRDAALWDEVRNRLTAPAMELSGGQQQRLCIARTLAVEPEIILFDEPTSALDPVASARIEELISRLGESVTILIVTHNMQQARRISHYAAFMYMGKMVEFGQTAQMFTQPRMEQTAAYIEGRYG